MLAPAFKGKINSHYQGWTFFLRSQMTSLRVFGKITCHRFKNAYSVAHDNKELCSPEVKGMGLEPGV